MEKIILEMLDFLRKQDDIVRIDINSDIEYDQGSFSISGLKIESKKFIYPAALGFDVGCGVGVYRLCGFSDEKLQEMHCTIKSIFGIRRKKTSEELCYEENHLFQFQKVMNKAYYGEIETGNHFAEILKDKKNNYFLMIHSGISEILREQFEILFINFYRKYVTEDPYGYNGYIVKIPCNSGEGKIFCKICEMANKWAARNRNYIAQKVGECIGCSVEYYLDTSHEYLEFWNESIIHSNGVQKLIDVNGKKLGSIISGNGCNTYLICGKHDNTYINHGTKLKMKTANGDRLYGDVAELMKDPEIRGKIDVINILMPIVNCKKVGGCYEYIFYRNEKAKID